MKILNFGTIENVLHVGQDKSHVVVPVDNIDNVSPRNSTVENVGVGVEVGVCEKERVSSVSVSECCVELDLESVDNVDDGVKRDCRICHLSMDMRNHDDDQHESGIPIELGCSCKDDLAAAHKQCAEAWFKVKGNKTCEICGSIARNVSGIVEVEMTEQWSEANDASVLPPTRRSPPVENQRLLHRFLNFLLACMVIAFVISWLFRFYLHS